jgi:hypothetical protein
VARTPGPRLRSGPTRHHRPASPPPASQRDGQRPGRWLRPGGAAVTPNPYRRFRQVLTGSPAVLEVVEPLAGAGSAAGRGLRWAVHGASAQSLFGTYFLVCQSYSK